MRVGDFNSNNSISHAIYVCLLFRTQHYTLKSQISQPKRTRWRWSKPSDYIGIHLSPRHKHGNYGFTQIYSEYMPKKTDIHTITSENNAREKTPEREKTLVRACFCGVHGVKRYITEEKSEQKKIQSNIPSVPSEHA